MARNTIYIDLVVDDNGTTRKVAVDADRLSESLGRTSVGAAQADRNIKGAAQASSNATKNFSKMSQGMGGLVAVYATLAAQVFALSAAYQFLLRAADFRILMEGQKALTQATGTGYASITKSIQAATGAQLSYTQAAQAAAIGTASGLGAGMLQDIAKYSTTISAVLGRDLEDTFNRLVRGITKAEPELLDELGIVLRLADATSEYARTLGKTATELTAYERTQGVAIFTLRQAEEKYGDLGDATVNTQNEIRKLGVAFSEVANVILPVVSSIAEGIAKAISGSPSSAILAFGGLVASVIGQTLPSTDEIRQRGEKNITALSEKIADLKIRSDEYARSQDFLTSKLAAPIAKLREFRTGLTDLFTAGGLQQPKFLEDISRLTAGPIDLSSVRGQLQNLELERMGRAQGLFGVDFGALTDQQLDQAKNALNELVTQGQVTTSRINESFFRSSIFVGERFNYIRLRWAQAAKGIQTIAVFTGQVITGAFKFLAIIGTLVTVGQLLNSIFSTIEEKTKINPEDNFIVKVFKSALMALTSLWSLGKRFFSWMNDTFLGGNDTVENQKLSDRIVGTGEDIEVAKKRVDELESLQKRVAKIFADPNFSKDLPVLGNVASNLPIQEIDDFIKKFREANLEISKLNKEQANFQSAINQSAGKLVKLGNALEDTNRKIQKDRESDSGSSDAVLELNRQRDTIKETINATEIANKKLRESQKEARQTEQALTRSFDEQKISISTTALAYAKLIPTLSKYVDILDEASRGVKVNDDELLQGITAVKDNALAFSQAAASLKQYEEGYKTLQKEIIDSAALTGAEKLFSNVAGLVINLADAFKFASQTGQDLGVDSSKLKAEFADLTKIAAELENQLNTAFRVKNLEVQLSGLSRQIDVFRDTQVGVELINQQALKENELEIAKIDEQLSLLGSKKTLFDFFNSKSPELQKFIKAASTTVEGTALAAAGVSTAKSISTSFDEGSNAVKTAIKDGADYHANRMREALGRPDLPSRTNPEASAAPAATTGDTKTKPESTTSSTVVSSEELKALRKEQAAIQENAMLREAALLQEQRIYAKIFGAVQASNKGQQAGIQYLDQAEKINLEIAQLKNSIAGVEGTALDQLFLQIQSSNNLLKSQEKLNTAKDEAGKVEIKALEEALTKYIEIANQDGKITEAEQTLIDRLKEGVVQRTRVNDQQRQLLDLQYEYNAALEKQKLLEARDKFIEERYKLIQNSLDIEKQLVSLSNPFLQDELSARIEIRSTQEKINELQQKLDGASPARRQELLSAIENEKARLYVLEQQTDEVFKIGQAIKSTFSEGLRTEIANVLKGGKLDIEQSFLNILKSVGEAAADQLADIATKNILSAIGFGEEDEAEKISSAMRSAADYHASVIYGAVRSGASGAPSATPEISPLGSQDVEKNTGDTARGVGTLSDRIGRFTDARVNELKGFASDVKEGFTGEMGSFSNGIKAIFTADAPWIRSMVGGITGALATVVAGAFGGGGGSSKDSWRNAIIGGIIGGASMAFTSWLTATPAVPATPATSATPKANGGVLKGGFREFAKGGVVNKPTLGLVGEGKYNEAVVPLPDGKSIPVVMNKEAQKPLNFEVSNLKDLQSAINYETEFTPPEIEELESIVRYKTEFTTPEITPLESVVAYNTEFTPPEAPELYSCVNYDTNFEEPKLKDLAAQVDYATNFAAPEIENYSATVDYVSNFMEPKVRDLNPKVNYDTNFEEPKLKTLTEKVQYTTSFTEPVIESLEGLVDYRTKFKEPKIDKLYGIVDYATTFAEPKIEPLNGVINYKNNYTPPELAPLSGVIQYTPEIMPTPIIPRTIVPEAPQTLPNMMQNGNVATNNVGINVTVNNNGSTQAQAQPEMSNERAVALAQAMQNVVTQELKRQKRPGGLLSPYA